jgi:hypothetical protein
VPQQRGSLIGGMPFLPWLAPPLRQQSRYGKQCRRHSALPHNMWRVRGAAAADRAVELRAPAILFRTIQVCPKDLQATLR